MIIKELINELQLHDPNLEVVITDGYGLVEEILEVSLRNVDDSNSIVDKNNTFSKEVLIIGWNI
jgi:hypothetical protein